MVLLSRRFKLEYTDSNGDTQVMADTGDDGGDLLIDRHVHIRRKNDPDILKLRLEGTNFDQNIPTRKSEFGTADNGKDEPEILYKQYDPDNETFITRNRFYAKNTGTINENGELALKLYSFYKFTARQSVNTGSISTDIEAALSAVLPSGYVADVPSGVSVPSVNSYSLDARREKGYQELTRNYNFAMTFTSNLDSNDNYKVKFEPEGFGGSVDTLDKSQDTVLFKSWEKDKSESIVNKVKVEGINANGNTVTATATNQTQIDNFGEKFRKFKIGYVENSTEAENIAEKYLVPGLNDDGTDVTKVPEAGTVKSIVYSDNIVNDSINVIDDKRNIDDTFTVVQQRNFWPEGASELEFEFEQENLEEEARETENLRDERARVYPSNSSADVGEQGLNNADTGGDTSNAERDPFDDGVQGDNSNAERDPNDDGVQGDNSNAERDPFDDGVQDYDVAFVNEFGDSFTDTRNIASSGWSYLGAVSVDSNKPVQLGLFAVTGTTNTNLSLDILVTNNDEDTIISHQQLINPFENDAEDALSGFLGSNFGDINWRTLNNQYDFFKVYVASNGSNSGDIDYAVSSSSLTHSHPDDVQVIDNTDHDHPDDVQVIDVTDHDHPDQILVIDNTDHGDSSGGGGHDVSGTTDSETLQNLLSELKTDR